MSERIKPGVYKARGILGSDQFGRTSTGNEQVTIDLMLDTHQRVTTFLVFSEKSSQYSIDRLKALGWKGGTSFDGIDQNEVEVEIRYELYQDKEQMKVEIVTAGRFVMKEPGSETEKRDFMKRLSQQAADPWDKPGVQAAPPTQQQQPIPQVAAGGGPRRF